MVIEASAKWDKDKPVFERLAYMRTARRLMEGTAYVKNSVLK